MTNLQTKCNVSERVVVMMKVLYSDVVANWWKRSESRDCDAVLNFDNVGKAGYVAARRA